MEKDETGELALRRESTRPRVAVEKAGLPVEAFDGGVADALEAALQDGDAGSAERDLLGEYARRQWIATPNTTRRTTIGALFQGQSLKTTTCSRCGLYSPSSADPFLVEEVFTAPVARQSRASLQDLIEQASRDETPRDFKCDRCKRVGTTVVRVGLVRLPAVYIIRINRVNFDRYGRESRVSTSIDYPDTLDLADGQMWWADTPLDYHGRPCGVRYQLYAVVFHRGGTVRSGHYFASVHSSTGTQPSAAQEARGKSGGGCTAGGDGQPAGWFSRVFGCCSAQQPPATETPGTTTAKSKPLPDTRPATEEEERETIPMQVHTQSPPYQQLVSREVSNPERVLVVIAVRETRRGC